MQHFIQRWHHWDGCSSEYSSMSLKEGVTFLHWWPEDSLTGHAPTSYLYTRSLHWKKLPNHFTGPKIVLKDDQNHRLFILLWHLNHCFDKMVFYVKSNSIKKNNKKLYGSSHFQGSRFRPEHTHCLCGVSHVPPVFAWISSVFSGFLWPTKKSHVGRWSGYATITPICEWVCQCVLTPCAPNFTTTLTRIKWLMKVNELISHVQISSVGGTVV